MKNYIILNLIASMFLACSPSQTNQVEEVATGVAEVSIPQIDIVRFEIDAGQYVGSEIAVSGIVDHVCKH